MVRYQRVPVQIPAPVQKPSGLGDLVAGLAGLLGFKKPCGGCEERKRLLNQHVQFVPPGYRRGGR